VQHYVRLVLMQRELNELKRKGTADGIEAKVAKLLAKV
jgi:hypothetical protein